MFEGWALDQINGLVWTKMMRSYNLQLGPRPNLVFGASGGLIPASQLFCFPCMLCLFWPVFFFLIVLAGDFLLIALVPSKSLFGLFGFLHTCQRTICLCCSLTPSRSRTQVAYMFVDDMDLALLQNETVVKNDHKNGNSAIIWVLTRSATLREGGGLETL